MRQFQNLFPVNLQANWQNNAPDDVSSVLRDWLFDPHSLTARLQQHCKQFDVVVLGQKVIACPAHESCRAVAENEQVLAREVLLLCDGVPHVFARSLLPLSSLTGEQKQLATLGEQPLGQVIFSNPSLERQLIQVAKFDAKSSVGKLAAELDLSTQTPMWGRRSLFYLENKPLVVVEVFLSPANAYR